MKQRTKGHSRNKFLVLSAIERLGIDGKHTGLEILSEINDIRPGSLHPTITLLIRSEELKKVKNAEHITDGRVKTYKMRPKGRKLLDKIRNMYQG